MNDAGRIGFLVKGTYDNTATYDFLDVVYYNNATYVAKKLTVGNKPQSSNEFWQVLMDKNEDSVTAEHVIYDNENSGLQATNTQEAIDEVKASIPTQASDIDAAAVSHTHKEMLTRNKVSVPAKSTIEVLKLTNLYRDTGDYQDSENKIYTFMALENGMSVRCMSGFIQGKNLYNGLDFSSPVQEITNNAFTLSVAYSNHTATFTLTNNSSYPVNFVTTLLNSYYS